MSNQQSNVNGRFNHPHAAESQPQKLQFNLGYVFIILIFAVMVAYGILTYTKYINNRITSLLTFPEMKKDQIAGWQTYRNEELGYEIKYPPIWKIEKESILVRPPDIEIQKKNKIAQGDFSLLIQVKETPRNNLEEYVRSLVEPTDEVYEKYCSSYLPRLTTLPFQIDGKKAFRIFRCGVGGGIPSEETFISNERGGVFQFSCLVSFEGYPDYSKYYSSGECNKILETFKVF